MAGSGYASSRKGYRDRPDVPFYIDAALEANGPVLELACGTGRVLVPIARKGVPVTGLDSSVCMLDVCRRRLAAEPEKVQASAILIRADMRDFDLDERFNLVTLPFRPFQHLTTVEDQRTCLGSIHRHLNPGGRVILDLFNQVNRVEMIYYVTHPDGRTERLVHAFAMRHLFRFETEHLPRSCGFSLLHVYADFQKHP